MMIISEMIELEDGIVSIKVDKGKEGWEEVLRKKGMPRVVNQDNMGRLKPLQRMEGKKEEQYR